MLKKKIYAKCCNYSLCKLKLALDLLKIYKVNNLITAPTVRLIGEDGKQIGVLSRDEAMDFALGQGADLVLIGESANPPVAKVVDFKKFLYQEQKKEADSKRSQKASGIKEIRIGSPFAGKADVEARITKAKKFLDDGFKVKMVVKFKGREITHPEFGHKVINRIVESLKDSGKVDRESRFEGKFLSVVISPVK